MDTDHTVCIVTIFLRLPPRSTGGGLDSLVGFYR